METEFCLEDIISKKEITDNLLSLNMITKNQDNEQNTYFVRNEKGNFDVIDTDYFSSIPQL
jgi:hypothetical protein